MPQSRVGSMQGSNKYWLPMKRHTRRPQCYQLNEHTEGGRTHNVTQQTGTHIFRAWGRTKNVTHRTDTQIFLDTHTNK